MKRKKSGDIITAAGKSVILLKVLSIPRSTFWET